MKLPRLLFFMCLCLLLPLKVFAQDDNTLNIYIWYAEVPDKVIHQFEKETGIKVNYATYDDNETMYAKLKASGNSGYDIIEPSSYYVDRMSSEGMLQKINKNNLSNYHNLDPEFMHTAYDPNGDYCLPYIWGVTGIYVNDRYYDPNAIKSWSDLWQKKYYDKISLLNDPREVFSIGFLTLGYNVNDSNPTQIKQAYKNLQNLLPNVRLFNSDAIPSIFIDEDATLGMAWNGDIYRASQENPHLKFIFPQDGFVIWVDNFAIPKNAPHLKNAYKFLNFMLRPDIAAQATLAYGYSTTNKASRALLPDKIRNNPVIFPSAEVLKRGQFQTNIDDKALDEYAKYWELLKIQA